MSNRALILIAIVTLSIIPVTAHSADFYLNDRTGHDAAPGTSPQAAWKTIARLERQVLEPGDTVHFAAGGVWRESLTLRQSGTIEKPITLTGNSSGFPDGLPDFFSALMPTIVADEAFCLDASVSHLRVHGLRFARARGKDRGAIQVWADRDLTNIEIDGCEVIASAGRGIWIAGDTGRQVTGVAITGNDFDDNAGCGLLVAKLAESRIVGNTFSGNCRESIDPWQAAIRVWSADVRDLKIVHNNVFSQRSFNEKVPAMGIHVDEVGANVSVRFNAIRSTDGDGIVIENAAVVHVEQNHVHDANAGIFVFRAGHDHAIIGNHVQARALGIVLHGHRANGVDAGPEIERDGKLFTGNAVRGNDVRVVRYASLKCTGGAEHGQTTFADNDFGPDRPSIFEWGERQFDTAAAFTATTKVATTQTR
jgi:hypothetical protein